MVLDVPPDYPDRRRFTWWLQNARGWCDAHAALVRRSGLNARQFARIATIEADLVWHDPTADELAGVVAPTGRETAAAHRCPLDEITPDQITRLTELATPRR
jgi:hypothetical protein